MRVVQGVHRLEKEVLADFPSPQESGFAQRIALWERFSPFPTFAQASLDHPLAESGDLTAFRKPFSQINELVLEEHLRKGVEQIVQRLRVLITKLEAIEDREVKRVGAALRVKYATILQKHTLPA